MTTLDDGVLSSLQHEMGNLYILLDVISMRVWDKQDYNRDKHTDALLDIALTKAAELRTALLSADKPSAEASKIAA